MRTASATWRLSCALALLIARGAWAQTPASSIQGTVQDGSGAVVVGATVVVTNTLTGVRRTSATNGAGEYFVPYLISGEYQLSAEAPGFKRFVRDGISLQMDQKARVDVELALGSTTETVVVEAGAPLLESEHSTVGQVVNLQQVRDLPLQGLGRDPNSLVALVPGVFNQSGAAYPSISGGRSAGTAMLLDGIGNNNMQPMHTPSVDAVQEFKVYTHSFSAEYGRTGGGIVSMSIKSGTNQYHGNLFEFFRNDVLNARSFFSLPNDRRPVLRYNEFGGTFGGPVRIPGLIDGRNKLFFFASFQGVRQHTAGTAVSTVPTALQSRGIFTEGNQSRIYDPATTRPDPANPSRQIRDLFAGNQLPASRIDPAAAKLMALFPPPNASGLVSNFVLSGVGVGSTNTTDNRIDYHVSDSDNLMFRHSQAWRASIPGKVLPGLADRTTGVSDRPDKSFTLQEVHTFSPRLINEFRIGVSHIQELKNTIGYPGNQAAAFGIPNFPTLGMPVVNIAGTTGLGPSGSRELLNQAYQYLFLVDSVTYVRSKHVLKAGVDLMTDRHRRFQPDVGTFNFDALFTSQPNVAGTGIGMASFLLGLPTGAQVNLSQIALNFRAKNLSFYMQDDWKVTSGLTLNLGFRFDGLYPMFEADDQISNFNLGAVKLERAGQDGHPRSPYDFSSRPSPRLGFAWQPAWIRGTVLRGGYGLFNSMVDRFNQPVTFPWGMQGVVTVSSPDNLTPPFVLSQGPPAALLRALEGVSGPGFGPSGLTNLQRSPSSDYIQNWQLSLQRELLSQKLLVEVAYGGSKGTHMLASVTANQVPLDRMGPGDAQSRRPFPQFQTVTASGNLASSVYHSLQVKAEGRMGARGGFLVSYTYSREINDIAGPAPGAFNSGIAQFIQNAYRLRDERGIGGFNFPQRLIASYTYSFPFGKGRRWLTGGVPGAVAGGWKLSGITTLQSGGPVQVSVSPNNCNCFNGGLRPNRISDGRLPGSERTLNRFFDTSAFAAPTAYTFGNSEKNPLLGPGTVMFDTAVSRRINVRASDANCYLEFRAEFFNFFNTPQFGSPSGVFGTPQFGRISSAGRSRVGQFALKFYF